VDCEIRALIRQMCSANPLWGAPRIHGELLKLGIEISQATVAKYMVRRRGTPSPTWRSFLRNQAQGIAAIDMFVVASVSFRLLYVMIILGHYRRKIISTAVTEHPTAVWLSRQVTEAFSWDTAPRYLLRDRDASYGSDFCSRVQAMGISQVVTAPTRDRFDPSRVSGSYRDLQQAPSAPRFALVRRLLSSNAHPSFARQGLPRPTPDPAAQDRKSRRHTASQRAALSLRTPRRLIRTRSCEYSLRSARPGVVFMICYRWGFLVLD